MKKRTLSLILALVMILSMIPMVSAKGLDNFKPTNTYTGCFADVAAGDWYASSVRSAYELGLIKGISETEFNPNGNITLAEAIALACRLHNITMMQSRSLHRAMCGIRCMWTMPSTMRSSPTMPSKTSMHPRPVCSSQRSSPMRFPKRP